MQSSTTYSLLKLHEEKEAGTQLTDVEGGGLNFREFKNKNRASADIGHQDLSESGRSA